MRRFVIFVLATVILTGTVSAETPASSAIYTVTFTSNWSQTTHPHPSGDLPGSAHWSAFVGGTHNDDVAFWQTGALASSGMELVAELGQAATFLGEINDEIANGNADQTFNFGALWSEGGTVTGELTMSSDFPNVTVASMIAPSPDWFVGVSGLSLWDGLDWEESVTVDLYPHDAGTEDGADYSLSNPATVPPQMIRDIRGEYVFSAEPVGTLTFVKQTPTAVSLVSAGGYSAEATLPTLITVAASMLIVLTMMTLRLASRSAQHS